MNTFLECQPAAECDCPGDRVAGSIHALGKRGPASLGIHVRIPERVRCEGDEVLSADIDLSLLQHLALAWNGVAEFNVLKSQIGRIVYEPV